MFREKSEYLILSWEEIVSHCQDITAQIEFSQLPWKDGIRPKNKDDQVVAAIIATALGVSVVSSGGVLFSIFEQENVEACIFREDSNSDKKSLFVAYNHSEQKIVFPWKNL